MESKIIEAIKARNTLIFVETREEEELIGVLKNVSSVLNYSLVEWNSIENFKDISPEGVKKHLHPMTDISNLNGFLNEIDEYRGNAIYILKDIGFYLNKKTQSEVQARLIRRLRNLRYRLLSTNKTIIMIGRQFNLPCEIEDDVTIIQHKMPDNRKLEDVFLDFIATNNLSKFVTTNEEQKNEIIKSAKGLTSDQFRTCLAQTLVKNEIIDTRAVDEILESKKQIIKKSGILEYIDENVGMEEVGGLENLKAWIRKRQKAFSPLAAQLGLPSPKAILVFGVPGSGKSLVAKAISSSWRRPILRFDIGRVFGSFVGESDKNMREALETAEAVAPCILWIDEIEKAFAGASGGHETTVRVLGNFLTWMQEKKADIFIVATANDITQLPAEYLRKGRFDELFFVGLPNSAEIREIIQIQLKKYKLNVNDFDIEDLISIFAKRNTGAEIEQAIIEAKYNAFDANRKPNTDDIRDAVMSIKPIFATFKNKMENDAYKLAVDSAKPASKGDF